MDGEKEVAFGVGKDVVVENCDFQDLKESNEVNHVNHVVGGDDSGSRCESVDNSYVFVSGNHDVPVVIDSKEFNVEPNEDTLDASVPGNRGLGVKEDVDVVSVAAREGWCENVDESVDVRTELAPSGLCVDDVVPLDASSESLDQDIVDAVLETSIQPEKRLESEVGSLEVDTGVGGSVELKGEESFFGKCGDRTEMIEEAVSRKSFELLDKDDCRGVELNVNGESREFKNLEGVELDFDDTRDEIKERCDDVPRGLDSAGVVLVASAESGKSQDLEGLALGVMDSDNHKPSDELSLCQDSQVLILRMNADSGESKDLENVTLDTNNTSEDNKESMGKIAETSDLLSADQDSQDMELEANSQPRDVSGSSDENETGDEYKQSAAEVEVYDKPIEVQECVAMDLKHDQESDISRESISLALEVRESGDEDLKSKDKQCETSDDLTEVQGATNTIEADGYQLEETESEKFSLKEKRDCESLNHNNDEHESEIMVSEAPACQSEDENLESNDKRCEPSDDLAEVQGATNTIEADGYQLEETESEKFGLKEKRDCESFNHNNDEHESKVMVSDAPACKSEDENLESNDKPREPSDDLAEVQGASNTIEADGYQLEEIEYEKLNLEEQTDCEPFNHNSKENESEVMVSEAPACHSEDVKIMKLRSDPQLVSEKVHPLEEGGTAQIHGVLNQVDVDSQQEPDSADIQDNLIIVRMQHTINKTAVGKNELDPALCQHEFDSCAPQLNGIVQQHDEPCEQADGSVNILFGSLRTETAINSKTVNSNGSSSFACEDSTADHEVVNQSSALCGATKLTETESKPGKSDEGLPSDCQNVTMEHEIELQSPKVNKAECTDNGVVFPFGDTKSGNIESGVMSDNGVPGGLGISRCVANEAGLEAETVETIDKRAKTLDIQDDDANADVNLASKLKDSSSFGSRAVHINSDTMVLESSNKEGASNLISNIAEVKSVGDDLNDAVKIKDIRATDESQSGEVSADLTGSSTSATAAQELKEAMQRPFNFLVKLPRFDDGILREQIRLAQREVDEKTRHRDALRVQIQNKRHNLHAFGVAYDAAGCEEIDTRKLLKATRIKIESLQSLIGRVKNAISVEDIDATIYNIEHQMQHETLSLKEEKQSIREIKQLKQHREYLSANVGSQDEIQQALDQKDQNEDRLKALKKELVELKEKVLRAQAAAATAGKKYENENTSIQGLQNQYRVANDDRQAAYENLLSLKKQLYEKHGHFRKYKNDVSAANDYAFSRNKIALNRLCAGQTEMMMELWNKNEEFREEYVRCNLRSTVRRLGTVDGRSLGPNEEPPLLPSYGIVRVDRLTSNPNKNSPIVEAAVEKKIELKIATDVVADHKPVKEMTGSVNQAAKMVEPKRFRLDNGVASSPGADMSTSINGENLRAEEEHDLARKSEDSLKEVETATLKEQDRLDEIAKAKEALERKKLDDIVKAKEALERKKRLAEKAQIRAELRAQKEAEQREKEREKRLRKKERRRTGTGEASESNNHGKIEQSLEAGIRAIAEPAEAKENPAAVVTKPQKPSHFVKQSKSKPLPPALRNRNRRKLQQWMYAIVACLLVIALFLLGNLNFFTKVSQHKSGF